MGHATLKETDEPLPLQVILVSCRSFCLRILTGSPTRHSTHTLDYNGILCYWLQHPLLHTPLRAECEDPRVLQSTT